MKLVGGNITANFVPAPTDYLKFEKHAINIADFIINRAIVTVQAEVVQDAYVLRDFGIGEIRLSG